MALPRSVNRSGLSATGENPNKINPSRMSRSLFKSTSVVSALTLLSRILGLVRDVTLAAAFGGSWLLDAFFFAQMLTNLGRRMFAEGAFSQAFIPVFTETKTAQPVAEVR